MKTICSNINLDPNFEFKHLAESLERYSGADIQSLVYTAHLACVQESLNPNVIHKF